MSVAFEEIRYALMTELKVYQATNVAWPNMKYKPVKGTGYLEPQVFYGQPEQGSLGDNGTNRQVGVLQVLAWEPVGKGSSPVTVKADEVVTQFKRGTTLTRNSTVVRIESAGAGGMVQEGDWVHIPISIMFYSYTSN